MASEDKKEHSPYLPNLWHSLVQVIVHSRFGEKTCTVSKSPAKGSSMFNVEIKINEEITQEVKKCMGNQVLSADQPFSIEILLQTKDGESMVLEVWTLSLKDNTTADSSQPKTNPILTDRMSVLLKSAICVTRITPAYKLSFRQGCETYVILYRLYTGKPIYDQLGENIVKLRVAQTDIDTALLKIKLAYRTELTFPSPPRASPNDQMMLKSDHFKVDASPKHCRRTGDRTTDSSSENAQNSDESQDAFKIFATCPMDMHSASPRSRTSSESSNRGAKSSATAEKIYVPFAYQKSSATEDTQAHPLPDIPFSNLLISVSVDKAEEVKQEIKERRERRISETGCDSKFTKAAKASEKHQMNTSDNSAKSFSSLTAKDDDYVVIDLKTPFVGSDNVDVELNAFFKECQEASQFQFSEPPPVEDPLSIYDQIKVFEASAGDFDELVKSLHSDDQSSLEFG